MIPYETIRRTVVKGLKDYLKIPFYRAGQEGESEAYPYGTFVVITDVSQNNGTWGEFADGKARKQVGHTWSVTFQSDKESEAYTYAAKAREWLDYIGTTYLNDNGVVVQSVGSIQPRDNIITIGYEYKRGFDVFFTCFDEVESYKETAEPIEKVTYESEINRG